MLRVVLVLMSCGLFPLSTSSTLSPISPLQSWPVHSMDRPRPPVVAPGPAPRFPAQPPSDAIILFNGRNLLEWEREDGTAARWVVRGEAFEVAPGTGSIRTRRAFGDIQMHIEWATPIPPRGTGQGRGNSGVFLMGYYEVQILDSYGNDTYADGQAAALYGQHPPMANASRAPGEWQSYDIFFSRPRFSPSGELLDSARITVIHNGVLVHNAVAFQGRTAHQRRAAYEPHPDRMPVLLQDHGDRVRFRNVWVRELTPVR